MRLVEFGPILETDILTKKWTNGIDLPFTAYHSALVSGSTKHAAYLVGGYQDGEISSRIFGMKRQSGEWEEVGSFTTPRTYHVAFRLPKSMVGLC